MGQSSHTSMTLKNDNNFQPYFQCNNSFRVELPGGSDDKYTIRFSTGLGNTILLSDMNRNNQGIWNVDLNGKLRKKIGGYVSSYKLYLLFTINLILK